MVIPLQAAFGASCILFVTLAPEILGRRDTAVLWSHQLKFMFHLPSATPPRILSGIVGHPPSHEDCDFLSTTPSLDSNAPAIMMDYFNNTTMMTLKYNPRLLGSHK